MREQNEKQLDRLADMLDGLTEIVNDPEVKGNLDKNPARGVSKAIRLHKAAVVRLLAAFEGIDEDEYEVPDPLTLFGKFLRMIRNPEVAFLFPSLAQRDGSESSGPDMANTEDGAV